MSTGESGALNNTPPYYFRLHHRVHVSWGIARLTSVTCSLHLQSQLTAPSSIADDVLRFYDSTSSRTPERVLCSWSQLARAGASVTSAAACVESSTDAAVALRYDDRAFRAQAVLLSYHERYITCMLSPTSFVDSNIPSPRVR